MIARRYPERNIDEIMKNIDTHKELCEYVIKQDELEFSWHIPGFLNKEIGEIIRQD